jgi:hypothetical protein
MWWIIAGSLAGYLVIVRGTYGFLAWQGLLQEPADYRNTSAQNTRSQRLFNAWLWPVMLASLGISGGMNALSAFVTGGWQLPRGR